MKLSGMEIIRNFSTSECNNLGLRSNHKFKSFCLKRNTYLQSLAAYLNFRNHTNVLDFDKHLDGFEI